MNVPLTTADFCDRARVLHADRVGVVDEPDAPGSLGRLTYGELLRRADGMIRTLDSMGIRPGERVAIVSPNAAKLLIALYAVTGSGRILVPINFRLTADEVQFIVDDAEAALLLVDPLLDEQLATVWTSRRIVLDGIEDEELYASTPAAPHWPTIEEDQAATINYTSGTTSTPKGVVLTHRSHWLNAVTVGWALGLGEADRYLHTLPIFHVNGWGLPLACAALGVPQVIQRDVRGAEILRRVGSEGVTLLCGAAPVVSAIAQSAEALRDAQASVPGDGQTRMVSGGAPTPPPVIEHFERVTGWEMIHAYGLTETGPVLTTNRVLRTDSAASRDRAALLARAGAPLVGVQLSVDQDGQILARAAKSMTGYWGRPDLCNAAFRGGWFLTGDGGQFDDDGRLRVTDRKKDVIVTGGENVSSLEVEARLLQHPAVADVAVIGVPHPRWGETPKALVVVADGATVDADELIAFCREHLAHFKCPTSIEERALLPRTTTGKLQKFLLRDPYWASSREESS